MLHYLKAIRELQLGITKFPYKDFSQKRNYSSVSKKIIAQLEEAVNPFLEYLEQNSYSLELTYINYYYLNPRSEIISQGVWTKMDVNYSNSYAITTLDRLSKKYLKSLQ